MKQPPKIQPNPPRADWLVRDGETASLLRTTDWSATPLGPIDAWPEPLRVAVGVCLSSRFPMFVWWGPHLVNIYNDAYIPVLGKRHPAAFGRPAQPTWHEIWDVVGPQADLVMRNGEATWNERVLLVMQRHGFTEETYFTWSYSPIPDGRGGVGGLFCACTEDTPRVLAERERDRLDAQRRLALDAARMGWWHYDPQTRIATYDDRFREIFGVTGDHCPNDQILRRLHPDDLPIVWARVEAALNPNDPKPYSAAYRVLRDDGETRWVEAHGLATFAGDGPDRRAVSFVGTAADVTDRRLAEQSLQDAERRYRAVFEAARDALIIYTPDGVVVEVNPAATRLYGFAREELIGVNARDVLAPETLRAFDEFLRVAGAGGEYRGETVDRRKDGTVFPIEVTGTPVVYDGRPHVMSVIRDVTDRRRTADRINRMHAVAAALSAALTVDDVARVAVDQSLAAIGGTAGSLALLAPDGQTLEMARMTGYPPQVCDRWRRFTLDAPIPMTDAVRRAEPIFLDNPEDRLRRYPALAGVTADRGTRASACLPLLAGGRAVGVLGLSFNQPGAVSPDDREMLVTLARQCGQALERARLFEAERAARAEAERAGRMKDEFLATLSHELRTPLNAILGWSQILRGGKSPADAADVAEGLEIIERNARAQTRIIEDLLDMSRIVSGKVRLDVQRVDLAAVVTAAVDTVRPAADARGVRLLPVLDPLAAPVTGDPGRLQQIFWNLLSNAVKFTPRGGQVQVLLERVNSHVEVSVIDTGEGIDPTFLPHVFDRFRQADAGTSRRHGGLGLGLAIVKQLVELHGGAIRAKSTGPGQGATFVVALPLTVVHPEHEPAPERRHPADTDAVPVIDDTCVRVAGLRVLVVDDEPDAREMVRRLLADCGATVSTAASAPEALALLESDSPDVLVSDIGMPGEDGYSLIRRVRALPPDRGGRTPAVALTAYARAEDRMKAVLAGFQHHVVKPVEPAELLTMVATLAARPTPNT